MMEYNNLSRYGLNDRIRHLASSYDGLFLARVVATQRNNFQLMSETGEMNASLPGKWRISEEINENIPVIGDWVMAKGENEQAVIREVLPRQSLFKRKTAGTTSLEQAIAANIDTVFICLSADGNFNLRRMERYLASVWSSGATPCIIITKADLTEKVETLLIEAKTVTFGAKVIVCSARSELGLSQLDDYLETGKTYVFVGSSGVGKSTMINHLVGFDIMETGSVRSDGKGRHTTTTRELFITISGAIVIDTPGMREFQLAEADFDDAFPDIAELSADCRFRDCSHISEPGCAVREACENGELSEERLRNFFQMKKEIKYQEKRTREKAVKFGKQTKNPNK